MGKEEIKKVIDDFEEEHFTNAKDNLRKEIKVKIDSYLKNKLDLENEIPDEGDKK
jgi:hypothetical protein